MGICISTASSEIHQAEDAFEDNIIYYQHNINVDDKLTIGSIYSRVGTKGLNQDAAILYQGYGMEEGAFCGVFDGHGQNGHIVSKFVRNRLPSLLLGQKNALTNTKSESDNRNKIGNENDLMAWRDACVTAFKVVDKEIKLQESLDCSSSGTTAVVVIAQGDDLVIANLGDSRAVLGTIDEANNITAVQLTTDLKPSLPSEAERIRKCNGRVVALKAEPHIQRVWLPHEDCPGLAMSRSFGDFMLKEHGIIALPEICNHRVRSGDQFVVAGSDGIWDVLSNEEVAEVVWSCGSKQGAAKAVVDAAAAAWKTKYPHSKVDDSTVVCLFLQN